MLHNHSANKNIRRAVAKLNKSIKAHAYRRVLKDFKVENKAQFISQVVTGKISLPPAFGCTKQETAQSFWNWKIQFASGAQSNCEADFKYVRPKKMLGYGSILEAANKLGEFTWAQLLLSIPHHAQRIKEAYNEWGENCDYMKNVWRKDYSCKKQYVSFDSYANNYYNSYRAYFVKNRIMARVPGKRGVYQLTDNGKLLLSGMKQLNSMR